MDPQVDAQAVAEEGVAVVRRSSGGGPVLWDGDLLALDVILPRGHRLAGRDVVDAYRWLGEAIADGLRAVGVADVVVIDVAAARAARDAPGPAVDACFGGLSPFEVLAGGRKVVGLSQARRTQGALLQAGIPLALDSARLARLMGRDGDFTAGLAATAAGIREFAPGVEASALVEAVDRAVEARADAELCDDALRDDERAAIAAVRTAPVGAIRPRH